MAIKPEGGGGKARPLREEIFLRLPIELSQTPDPDA